MKSNAQLTACVLLIGLLGLVGAACGDSGSAAGPRACAGKKTPPDSGPRAPAPTGRYFDPGSPERQNVRGPRTGGIPLRLSGRVYDENCKPVARALLDFFQADSHGRYDRKEIRLHGHQFTDGRGRYLLRTIVPNHYLRRPPHIHVKVQAPYGPLLETQLFFPASLRAYGMDVGSLNARDRTIKRTKAALIVHLGRRTQSGYEARFDFVIAVARLS